jgi:hypothetical protein
MNLSLKNNGNFTSINVSPPFPAIQLATHGLHLLEVLAALTAELPDLPREERGDQFPEDLLVPNGLRYCCRNTITHPGPDVGPLTVQGGRPVGPHERTATKSLQQLAGNEDRLHALQIELGGIRCHRRRSGRALTSDSGQGP